MERTLPQQDASGDVMTKVLALMVLALMVLALDAADSRCCRPEPTFNEFPGMIPDSLSKSEGKPAAGMWLCVR